MSGRIDDMATALVDARTELKQIPPLRESEGARPRGRTC